jgi:hypothetical protein
MPSKATHAAYWATGATPKVDGSGTRIDIRFNGARASNIAAGLVPDLEGALTKCQWWQE